MVAVKVLLFIFLFHLSSSSSSSLMSWLQDSYDKLGLKDMRMEAQRLGAAIFEAKKPFIDSFIDAVGLRNRLRGGGGIMRRQGEKREQERVRERTQCLVSARQEFPCKMTAPSSKVPDSVHRLRPGDIKVIAGLGDSITAGLSAGAETVFDLGIENRDLAFSTGGRGDWREVTTLPNILRVFNPGLRGAATAATVLRSGKVSGYNLAVSGATSHSLETQAWSLVRRLRTDSEGDFHTDWKMVTVLMGFNDLCFNVCNTTRGFERSRSSTPRQFGQNMRRTLDVLHAHLPRTFVNVIPLVDITMVLDLPHKPSLCRVLHWSSCPCLFDDIFTSGKFSKKRMRQTVSEYSAQLFELIESGRYDTRPDFTVVFQPLLTDGRLPHFYNKHHKQFLPDLSYLALDCFHFSQKLHSMMARSLWNNLLQPAGAKTRHWMRSTDFLCPSQERPYLATNKQVNSFLIGSKHTLHLYYVMPSY